MAVQNFVSAALPPETKAGKDMGPFVDGCHAVQSHPEIPSGVFNRAEFDRDYAPSRDLAQITDVVAGLHEALTDTLVPGLGAVADQLGRFFARSPRPAAGKTQ